MKNLYEKLFIILLFCIPVASGAQSVTIDAEYRPRLEFRQGFKKPLADTLDMAAIIFQRTRLNADYKSNSLNAHLTLQDSRIWGQGDMKSTSPQMTIYEAWFDMLITSGLSVQAGRQMLKYDDQKLFGAGNWSNTGNSHDAAILKYNNTFLHLHLGVAYNNTSDVLFNNKYSVSGMYQSMAFIWASKELVQGLNLSLIGIGEALPRNMVNGGVYKTKTAKDSSSTMSFGRFTYGGNIVYKNNESIFEGALTFYLQSGKDSKMGVLSSYFCAVKGAAKISDEFKVQLGAEYSSGTSYGDTIGVSTKKSFTFNKLYGSNHIFNGGMEYWATLPSGGLADYYFGATYSIGKELTIDLTGHIFSLAQEMYAGKKLLNGKGLGGETDLTIAYQYSKETTVQCGYCVYFKTASTELFNSINVSTHSPQWAYVMLSVKPQLYKSAN